MGRPATSGSFRPGQSGNPAGRPKGRTPTQQAIADVRELAREHTVEAIDTLVSIATNTKCPAAARVGAAVSILDRGWGKPAQQMEIDHKETTLAITADMTPQQAAEAFAATLRGATVIEGTVEKDSEGGDGEAKPAAGRQD